ncbi:hypothetical protein SESBI_10306 [Sesbania bispinosa]|nr:hypothetical protein SESBI_10306 [Sesbania bispinosa]
MSNNERRSSTPSSWGQRMNCTQKKGGRAPQETDPREKQDEGVEIRGVGISATKVTHQYVKKQGQNREAT